MEKDEKALCTLCLTAEETSAAYNAVSWLFLCCKTLCSVVFNLEKFPVEQI